MNDVSARDEWRVSWPLPIAAMLGIAGTATFAYGSGVFLGPMTAEFGWTRTQFSSAFALQMLVSLVTMPIVGRLVDRFGSRPMALVGVFTAAIGLAQLGWLNNGSIAVWLASCLLQSGLTVVAAPPVWLTPVATTFHRSRGLALAIGLAGVGVAMTIWPILAALAVERVGWRGAFGVLALYWPVVVLPLTLLVFRRGPAAPSIRAVPIDPSFRYLVALRSRTFLCIMGAGGLYAMVSFGLTVHLVPILSGNGLGLTAAASIAGLTGVSSIVGRVGTGFLLDRLPAHLLGTGVFLVPIVVGALLWQGSTPAALVAVVLLGLAAGAETDIVVFLAARHFAANGFATIYAVATAVFGLCAAIGPLVAGMIFDRSGAYTGFFALVPPVVIAAVVLLWLVPRAPAMRSRAATAIGASAL